MEACTVLFSVTKWKSYSLCPETSCSVILQLYSYASDRHDYSRGKACWPSIGPPKLNFQDFTHISKLWRGTESARFVEIWGV